MRFQGHRVKPTILPVSVLPSALSVLALLLFTLPSLDSRVWGQSSSSVRSFDGGVTPLFRGPGIGSLYIDNQGTQGFLYNPGNNFQSYSFRNPTTGQAWSGAVTTFGPQLSIGLIQGANQTGSPLVLPGPPRQTAPLPSIQSTILDEIP
ncbi:MAG: hypothetical protein NTZ28_05380 [Nitrospirae bacterium]|jgi:hypothetical protein|nr:hypothetical protein [Nitrospirota bacterium]